MALGKRRRADGWSSFAARTLAAAACLLAAGASPSAGFPLGMEADHRMSPDAHSMMASARIEEPRDLTQLSLEQLMSLDITQINVLGAHTHLMKQWMIGYHAMFEKEGGYLDGTQELSNRRVLKQFGTIHTSMSMQMHMFELMYAPTDRWTVMAMVPYEQMSMKHLTRTGERFTTGTSGVGDVELMGLRTFYGNPHGGKHRLIFNAGLSLPSGTINARDDTPTTPNKKLEYRSQLGSGTVDLKPGITYLGETGRWAWGAQPLGTLRLGKNDNDYRFGNRVQMSAWGVYKVTDWLAPSIRMELGHWENVHGADPELDPTSNPETDPKKQGGTRADLLFGLQLYAPRGAAKGTRLLLEGGFPIYQSLSGPQLKNDWQITIGGSYTF